MFVNREKELESLRAAIGRPRPGLLRVFGRRRLGKTELLQRVCEERGGIYLLIDDADTAQVLASLSRQLAMETGSLATPYRSWDDLFEHLTRDHSDRFVVLDEFQRLIENDRSAVTRLQDHWDRKLRRSGPTIVLCGSSVGMMQRLTGGRKGPLFGRLTTDLRLRAFDYRAVRLLYPDLPEEQKVYRYAVFGGTPFYHQFSLGRALPDAIMEAFLEPTAPLRDEPMSLLQFELRSHTRYNSILFEIGNGTHALAELETKVGVKHGGLGPYLEVLKHDLDLVAMEEPVCGKRKQARYVMADPFFAFYYRFVFSDRPRLELGRIDAVLQTIQADLDGYVGRVFEDVARQALIALNGRRYAGVDVDFDRIGRWWNKQGEELDIVAPGTREILVGEVKWSRAPVGPGEIADVLRKASLIEKTEGKAMRPVIVARGGLTRDAEALAEREHALVLDLASLRDIFEGSPPDAREA